MNNYMALAALRDELRGEHRIKDGVDYSLIQKQDRVTLTCHAVYFDTILEVARKHGVAFSRAFMYDERSW